VLTYVDQIAVDEASLRPGSLPIIHSFSNKQRNFSAMSARALQDCVVADVREALTKYGGMVEIRRPGHPLFGRKVTIIKVHLIYDGRLVLQRRTRVAIQQLARNSNVEVHFHE
jgi:hypothetical protein